MKKNSQVTIFILLGIVVLAIFLLLLFISNTFGKAKFEKEIDKLVLDVIQIGALDYYIDACLKKSASEGLKLVGLQGGNIYEHQNGTIPLSQVPYLTYGNGTNITYGLYQSGQLGRKDFPPPWEYPRPYERLMYTIDGEPLYRNGWGFGIVQEYWWGYKTNPYLCQINGPNDVPETVTIPKPCEGEARNLYGPNSVQEQLQRYIEKKLPECVHFDFLKNFTNYNIQQEDPNVSITLGEANVFINASYPLSVTIGNYKTMRRVEFQSFVPVRLKKVYAYTDWLLGMDAAYLNFSVEEWHKIVPGYDSYLHVQRFPCTSCLDARGTYADIVMVVDKASQLEGKPYVFQTAIENRNPALDYLHTVSFPGHPEVDSMRNLTQTLALRPVAYDPDGVKKRPPKLEDRGDELTFHWTGWQETYTETFDGDLCKKQIKIKGYIQVAQNLFRDCITRNPNEKPYFWSSTWNGQTTDEYQITERDIGFHEVVIRVTDEQGLEDWQNVGIFIIPNEFEEYGCQIECDDGGSDCMVRCSCRPPGSSFECQGKYLDELNACVDNSGYCDELCHFWTPNQKKEACDCKGGYFKRDPKEGTACCSDPGMCVLDGVCVSKGAVGHGRDKICKDGNVFTCAGTMGNRLCTSYQGLYCDPTTLTWNPVSAYPNDNRCPENRLIPI